MDGILPMTLSQQAIETLKERIKASERFIFIPPSQYVWNPETGWEKTL